MGTTLPKPSLNISVIYVRPTMGLSGWAEHVGSQGPSNSPNRTFTIADSNTTYSVEDIEAIGSCQTLERYQWGFSLLQLLINVLLLLLWAIGVWILWLKAHKELQRRGGIEASSRYRAVLDLASALDQEVSKNGETARTLTNKQLTTHVKKRLRGGAFKVDTPAPTLQYRFWKSFWHWAWGHIWWILLFVCTSFMITLSAVSATMGASIAAALLIGKTTRTRILIFLAGVVVFGIVTVPLAFLALFVDLYPGDER
ncbi:hypothetical protein F5X68DRAFT_198362 [Plectosphaerella plurivora]|uniref:Uncharacterized protein n=1 Tax=Plectosphaerella plurivora TaxID=936078 RepID=A0A9P9AGA1_9PEZI|nr:hypothetical protein F5X68DRAFT_198362 [Plectosphaerella plurivora]